MAKEHAEIITAGGWVIPVFILSIIVGVVFIMASSALTFGWVRILLIVLGAIVGIIGIGSVTFAPWGKYKGFPWHFTP